MLLDTHALYWLVSAKQPLTQDALLAIGESQARGTLLISPISGWELAVAVLKNRVDDRPDLGDDPPHQWFRKAVGIAKARVVPIRRAIAVEAAKVIEQTGHKDPGDCFLIATARVRKVPLITRDAIIRAIARDLPNYLDVIVC